MKDENEITDQRKNNIIIEKEVSFPYSFSCSNEILRFRKKLVSNRDFFFEHSSHI